MVSFQLDIYVIRTFIIKILLFRETNIATDLPKALKRDCIYNIAMLI